MKNSSARFKKINSAHYLLRDYPPLQDPERIEIGTKLNIRQLVRAAELLPKGGSALFVCANAAVFQLAALRAQAGFILVTDFDPKAIALLKDWFLGRETHDWSAYLRYLLISEGKKGTGEELKELESEVRMMYKQGSLVLATFDIYNSLSFPIEYQRKKFDQVYSLWGIDATTDAKEKFWDEGFREAVSRLQPDGIMVMSIIRNAKKWEDGSSYYPNVPLTAEEIAKTVKEKFEAKKVQYQTHLFDAAGKKAWHYDGDDYLLISFSPTSPITDGEIPDPFKGEGEDWSIFKDKDVSGE